MVDSPVRILIAEDDRVSGLILEHHIKKWGYETCLVHDGEQAWQIIQSQPPEMALLDWMMPGIDGLELCRRLRQSTDFLEGEYIYIILLTARDERADLIRGLEAGADDYITKPLDLLELKARLNAGRRIVELHRLLKRQATYDFLTGLLNRRTILEQAEKEYMRAKREKKPLGLMLIDIDDFKKINDTFGHLAGDKILAAVAERLQRNIRSYDKIGRYGGDEILVLLPHCSSPELALIANRLRLCIQEDPITINHHSLTVSISAGGLAADSNSSLSLHELIALCDQALYQAKKQGRNQTFIIESIVLAKGEA
jgi:diguanylate cyclase (GGDEF)-like protein